MHTSARGVVAKLWPVYGGMSFRGLRCHGVFSEWTLVMCDKGKEHLQAKAMEGWLCKSTVVGNMLTRSQLVCNAASQPITRMSSQMLATLSISATCMGQSKLARDLGEKRSFSSEVYKDGSNRGEQGKEMISVTFVDKDGEENTIQVPVGMSMLEAAHQNDIDLEGACEGSVACSTCHVIVMDESYYNKLEEPTDEENDMLDLAFGLTLTSRLGCQLIARPELDGLKLALPAATRNFAVDGYVAKPH